MAASNSGGRRLGNGHFKDREEVAPVIFSVPLMACWLASPPVSLLGISIPMRFRESATLSRSEVISVIVASDELATNLWFTYQSNMAESLHKPIESTASVELDVRTVNKCQLWDEGLQFKPRPCVQCPLTKCLQP